MSGAGSATSVWRVRPSGINTNGGGFDYSYGTSSASGTHGSFAGTTFTDATAAAFTSGMVGKALTITGSTVSFVPVGQYLITAFINASNITLGSGNPALTLAGPLNWFVSAATDYSQQNAAQATGTHGAGSATTTFTDSTAAAFTAAMVGNAINIAGQGFYFVVSFTNASNVVVDRALGTFTLASWSLGGAWADFWTNGTSSGPIFTGNIVYILGSGTPNPASYTYDYVAPASVVALVSGTTVATGAGTIVWAIDPATPGYKAPPDTTGGMPVIQCTSNDTSNGQFEETAGRFVGLWFVMKSTLSQFAFCAWDPTSTSTTSAIGCVFDQFGIDSTFTYYVSLVGCEIFSSVSAAIGSVYTFELLANFCLGSNIHDIVGIALRVSPSTATPNVVLDTIFAKCPAAGVTVDNVAPTLTIIKNCTLDAITGIALNFGGAAQNSAIVMNNIISNCGSTALSVATITTSAKNSLLIDYNTFYNNNANYNTGAAPGLHDTIVSSSPYVSQTTEDYTLA